MECNLLSHFASKSVCKNLYKRWNVFLEKCKSSCLDLIWPEAMTGTNENICKQPDFWGPHPDYAPLSLCPPDGQALSRHLLSKWAVRFTTPVACHKHMVPFGHGRVSTPGCAGGYTKRSFANYAAPALGSASHSVSAGWRQVWRRADPSWIRDGDGEH